MVAVPQPTLAVAVAAQAFTAASVVAAESAQLTVRLAAGAATVG